MTQEIRIPDIGGDVDAVEVVEILVAVGDEVGEDDPVIVIESDKASMDVPAGKAGVIESIEVAVGDQVSEGQVIARLKDASAAKSADTGPAPAPAAKKPAAERQAAEKPAAEKSKADEPKVEAKQPADDKPKPKADATPKPEKKPAPAGKRRTEQVRVPDIGEAENVEVIEVAVKVGDRIAVDDVLVVVESDKASMEIPSTHSGTVTEVHVTEGTQIEAGTLLVTLETAADAAADAGADEAANAGEEEAAASQPTALSDDKGADAATVAAEQTESEPIAGKRRQPTAMEKPSKADRDAARPASPGAEVYAGPAVRRLARELGADLSAVKGTGNRGRIVKTDVKAYVKERLTHAASPAAAPAKAGGLPPMPEIDFSKFGEIEEQPLSRIRARGAENLHRSWLNIPHVTQHDEVDITDLEDFRGSLRQEGESRGIKVTPLAFIIKACCQALKEFPTVNASLDPSAKKFILKRYYHVGVAVDTPDGLVVPVVRDADRKGVWDLSKEVTELAEKARNKKLNVNEMQGGSFSVTSLGAIGGTGFTPIINGPEVAILGVGRLTVRPQWNGTEFVPRKMLPLSLSYDHRAINGAEAGRFVARLAQLLGDIRLLAL